MTIKKEYEFKCSVGNSRLNHYAVDFYVSRLDDNKIMLKLEKNTIYTNKHIVLDRRNYKHAVGELEGASRLAFVLNKYFDFEFDIPNE